MKRVFIAILTLIYCNLALQAANKLTLTNAEGAPGETVTVSIAMDNSDPIATLQLSLPLDGETHYVEGSAAMTERRGDHSVSAHETDGKLNIIVFSQSMSALQGNSGAVLTLTLQLGRKPTTLTLTPTNIIATDTKGTKVDCEAGEPGSVTTLCALATYSSRTIDYGRVPIRGEYTEALTINNEGNDQLTITALEFSSADFSVSESLPITIAPGSNRTITLNYAPKERGTVKETLKVTGNSVSRLNTITLNATPFAVNELHVEEASGTADSIITIHLTMNDMDAITGFQMTFDLPAEVEYVDGSFALSDRNGGHSLLANEKERKLTAIAYSTANNTFAGNDGEVASFKIKLIGPYSTTLNFSKAILTAQYRGKTMDVLSASYGANIGILSPRISITSNIDLGRTPVTETAKQQISVRNYGDAPLRIDRATFSESGLAIVEALPVVIEPYSSQDLTVETTDSEKKEINATMRLYNNAPDNRMVEVAIAGSRYITNAITASAPTAFLGRSAEVRVALDNTFDIKGLQMDVIYPKETLKPRAEQTCVKSTRMGDMTVYSRIMGDTIKIRAYSLTDKAIEKGNGDILSLFFNMLDNTTEGSATIRVANIKLSRTKDEEVHSDITDPTATINWYLLGDVNNDGIVDIADASAIASKTIGLTPDPFRTQVADVNQDQKVDVADASAIASIVIGK